MFVLFLLVFPYAHTANKLVIYSNNITQVHAAKDVSFRSGFQSFFIKNLPEEIFFNSFFVDLPESVSLRSISKMNIQNREGLESKSDLLNRLKGKPLYLYNNGVYRDVDLLYAGDYLAVDDHGKVLLDPKEDIAVSKNVFIESIPSFNVAAMVIEVSVDSRKSQVTQVPVNYITGQVGWKAIYNLYLDEKRELLDFSAFFKLNNYTKADFANTSVELVAGDINFEQEHRVYAMSMAKAAPESAQDIGEQPLGDYYKFVYPYLVTLKAREEKMLSWREITDIPVKKQYLFSFYSGGYPSVQKQRAIIKLFMKNTKENKLGMRFPAGEAFVYDNSSSRSLLGKVNIPNLTLGEEISLTIGKSFDLSGEKTHKKHEKITTNEFLDTFQVVIKNNSVQKRTVDVIDSLYGSWEVVSSNHKYVQKDANQLSFSVAIDSQGTTTINYQVKTR